MLSAHSSALYQCQNSVVEKSRLHPDPSRIHFLLEYEALVSQSVARCWIAKSVGKTEFYLPTLLPFDLWLENLAVCLGENTFVISFLLFCSIVLMICLYQQHFFDWPLLILWNYLVIMLAVLCDAALDVFIDSSLQVCLRAFGGAM